MKKIHILFVLMALLFASTLQAKNYAQIPEVRLFIQDIVKRNGFDERELVKLFSDIEYQKKALAVYVPSLRPIVKPSRTKPQKQGPWDRYSKSLLKEKRVSKGVAYMRQHAAAFNRAYKQYGVPPEYIAAIIGIESYYGVNTGKFPVLDTLTTLAFEPNRRQKFFRSELRAFLLMTKRERLDPEDIMGSYAGAIGLGQFMPSNYKSLVVDFDRDGKKRMGEHIDAIGSIAYYLKRNGWRNGEPVAVRVSYEGERYLGKNTGYKFKHNRASLKGVTPDEPFGYSGPIHLIKLERLNYDELWYGGKNFFVITRYNHSDHYAMAVHQLAQMIKEKYNKSNSLFGKNEIEIEPSVKPILKYYLTQK